MRNLMLNLLALVALTLFGAPLMAQCGCEGGKCGGGKCEGGKCEGCEGCKECEKKDTAEKKEEPKAEVKANVFEVSFEGMCCPMCAKAVQKRLAKIENVESAKADSKEGKAWVTMKEGKTLDKASVEKAMEGTEFKVTACAKFEAKAEAKAEEKKAEEKKTEEKKEEKKEGTK